MSTTPIPGETIQPPTARRRRGCLYFFKRGVVVLIVIAIAGAVYQVAATESDRRTYAPPGQLLSVDGHQMHILCMGSGNPTVILEAAGGHFSSTWVWVQPAVAQSTRVCAYDRAGYGWSDPGPEPRDAQQVASELHTLLKQAEVAPPYVLVGHSVGGLYIRVYSAQYPGEVEGMVLVDATHPDNWARQGESLETLQVMSSMFPILSRFGLMRLFFAREDFGLPEAQNAALKANIASSQYWDTQRADIGAMTASIDQGRAAGGLGDLPLEVLMTVDYPEGEGRDTELALQNELAGLSTNTNYQAVAGARHITLVTEEQFARFVSEAIISVVQAAREGQPTGN